jgi:hypothetical protein
MSESEVLLDPEVEKLRGMRRGQTLDWTDGRQYRVELNEGGRLIASNVPDGLKLVLELDKKAARTEPLWTAGTRPRQEQLPPSELKMLRGLRTGDTFYRDGKLHRVASRTDVTIRAVPTYSGGVPFTITLPEPRYLRPPSRQLPTQKELELEEMLEKVTQQTIRQIRGGP